MTPARPTLTETELDTAYTQFCHQMTALGEAQAPLFMARFALLAMQRVGDAQAVQQLITQAAKDMTPSAA
ncbi:MAG: hypothetical protein RSD57_08235 [Comamonas sp.]